MESELVAELPHPIYDDRPAKPAHVLLVLLNVARVDQVFLLFLAEYLKGLRLGIGIHYLLEILELLEVLYIILLLWLLALGEVKFCSVFLLLHDNRHRFFLDWFEI